MSELKEKIVEAAGLSKHFKDFWGRPKAKAVNSIDFHVNKGEVFGLLGPNGSGKSTTIKMLLGLLYPSQGALKVFGKSPKDVKTKQRIGYLPEETYLYKYLDAHETIDFFASLFQLSSADRKKRTKQLIDMVGLKNAGKRSVGEYSKGMARRIGLAQCLVNDPDLIILDEPTSGLDPIGCKEVKDLIKTMAARGKTVILSSHLLADVEDVVDRVVVLYGGQIRAQGTIDELLLVEEKTKIVTPRLSSELLDKVIKLLEEEIPKEQQDLSHPRKNLESFFLEVVNKARSEDVHTAGAQAGELAEYLQGNTDTISKAGFKEKAENSNQELKEQVISEKLSKLISHEEPKTTEIPEEKNIEPSQEKIDEKLSTLIEEKQDQPVQEPEVKKEEDSQEKINDKLKNLLGDK